MRTGLLARIPRLVIVAAVLSMATTTLSCGSGEGEEECDGPTILPNASPIGLGSFFPTGNEDPMANDAERTPFEFVLLLQATCGQPVQIEEVCVAGDGADQFGLEVSEPQVATPGEEAAVRLTYTRSNPGGPDQAAVVVQSNATNFPTLVVPICAQVVGDGDERPAVECTSPVMVAPGERDDSLCN